MSDKRNKVGYFHPERPCSLEAVAEIIKLAAQFVKQEGRPSLAADLKKAHEALSYEGGLWVIALTLRELEDNTNDEQFAEVLNATRQSIAQARARRGANLLHNKADLDMIENAATRLTSAPEHRFNADLILAAVQQMKGDPRE